MPDSVGHHYHRAGCGYDLFQQQLGGSCPECGKRIPKTRRLARSRNPKRVNAGLRSSIRAWERSQRMGVRVTIILFAIVMADVALRGPLWIAIMAGAAALIGVLSILVCSCEIAHARDRILPVATHRDEIPGPDREAS